MTLLDHDTIDGLTARLSDWSIAEDALRQAGADRSGTRADGLPRLLVRAHSVEEVQAVLAFASTRGVPVVTRGAGSGLAGAALAGDGAIVLDLSALNRLVELRVDDQIAVVEPGLVTAELDRAAARHGLLYAPDPGSVAISTVGGNIATNAGGLRGAKYGVTRDAVLALDVVLADGRRLHLGRETVKGVAGYDLTGLFVGSEGTLGVVVRAWLRLLPRPLGVATLLASFPSLESAADAATAIGSSGVRPAVLELIDARTLAAIDAAEGTTLSASGEAVLVAQTDGAGASAELEAIERAIAPFAGAVETTDDPAEGERLLLARRQALPSIERLGRAVIEDIAVPRSRLAAAVRGVQRIAERHAVGIFVFAHAGDGNVHPIILVPAGEPGSDPAEPLPQAVQDAASEVFALALSLGGTVTGEHGVGTLKRAWARDELGEDVVALQHAVKALLDPAGILNPGKAL